MATVIQPCLQWEVISRPSPGEALCGDLHLVASNSTGCVVAVADGLGHGDEAAHAAQRALQIVAENVEEHVIALMRLCHDGLRDTRGVTMSLASFHTEDSMMTWLAVGNVQGLLVRADSQAPQEELLMRGGVVGAQLPPLQAAVLPVSSGDVLVLATDGIRSGFEKEVFRSDSPQRIAERIANQHGKNSDDSLVLVARYAGAAS